MDRAMAELISHSAKHKALQNVDAMLPGAIIDMATSGPHNVFAAVLLVGFESAMEFTLRDPDGAKRLLEAWGIHRALNDLDEDASSPLGAEVELEQWSAVANGVFDFECHGANAGGVVH